MDIVIGIPLGLVAAMGLGAWHSYNRLVALDQRCDTALSDIDAQVKHRHSVLPNLVETVRGYVGHERAILDNLSKASVATMSARDPLTASQAEQELGVSLNRLFTLVEAFPDLKASHHFRE